MTEETFYHAFGKLLTPNQLQKHTKAQLIRALTTTQKLLATCHKERIKLQQDHVEHVQDMVDRQHAAIREIGTTILSTLGTNAFSVPPGDRATFDWLKMRIEKMAQDARGGLLRDKAMDDMAQELQKAKEHISRLKGQIWNYQREEAEGEDTVSAEAYEKLRQTMVAQVEHEKRVSTAYFEERQEITRKHRALKRKLRKAQRLIGKLILQKKG